MKIGDVADAELLGLSFERDPPGTLYDGAFFPCLERRDPGTLTAHVRITSPWPCDWSDQHPIHFCFNGVTWTANGFITELTPEAHGGDDWQGRIAIKLSGPIEKIGDGDWTPLSEMAVCGGSVILSTDRLGKAFGRASVAARKCGLAIEAEQDARSRRRCKPFFRGRRRWYQFWRRRTRFD